MVAHFNASIRNKYWSRSLRKREPVELIFPRFVLLLTTVCRVMCWDLDLKKIPHLIPGRAVVTSIQIATESITACEWTDHGSLWLCLFVP